MHLLDIRYKRYLVSTRLQAYLPDSVPFSDIFACLTISFYRNWNLYQFDDLLFIRQPSLKDFFEHMVFLGHCIILDKQETLPSFTDPITLHHFDIITSTKEILPIVCQSQTTE